MIIVDEFSFIDSIKPNYYRQSTIIKGIGDDGAVFRQTSQDIVAAVDTFVEDVHFSKKTMSPIDIGYRALAANMSDLAAMCATPAFYLVSIVIPNSWDKDDILKIFKGMELLAGTYQMDLIGGDTVSGKELSISITVIGYANKGKASYRSLTCEGDIVFVTGTLGDSQAGFHILMNDGHYIFKEYFIKRHQKPTPRIKIGQELNALSRVALNDISDGIANEAAEIAEASDVDIVLYEEKIPVSAGFEQFPQFLQEQWKYFGGEDFELLGTVSKDDWHIVENIAKKTGVDITRIGHAENAKDNNPLVYLQSNNQKKLLSKDGYIHFK